MYVGAAMGRGGSSGDLALPQNLRHKQTRLTTIYSVIFCILRIERLILLQTRIRVILLWSTRREDQQR